MSFQRTARLTAPAAIPPRSYGAAPLWQSDRAARAALAADVLVPVGEGEGVWLGLEPADDAVPSAIRVAVEAPPGSGLRDAVTGQAWSEQPTETPRNYVVSPPQRALYGVTAGGGWARQFGDAERPPGPGQPVLARLRLLCAPSRQIPTPGTRPTPPPVLHSGGPPRERAPDPPGAYAPQTIGADPHGLGHWSFSSAVAVTVGLVSPEEFEQRSGLPRPPPLDPSKVYGGWRLP